MSDSIPVDPATEFTVKLTAGEINEIVQALAEPRLRLIQRITLQAQEQHLEQQKPSNVQPIERRGAD